MIHNFFQGSLRTQPDIRYVPYMTAHSTDVKGISTINSSDNRFFNNVFAVAEEGTDPLGCYGQIPVPFVSEDNAVILGSKVDASCTGRTVILKINGLGGKCRVVESGMLGLTFLSGQPFENPDGTDICFSEDFFGNARNASGTAPGPFERKDGKDDLRHQSCESLPYSVSVIFE